MTDTFKEIGSLFGREGAGAGFAKQTDKESFTYAFAWPEGDTWATLTGYLNLDEQPEEYVRRVLQDGGFRSDWGNPDYDPIGDFKETAGDEYRIPLLKVLLREQLESRYEVANHFSTMNRARVELSAFIQNEGGAPLPEDALGTPEEQGIRAMLIATGEPPREVTLLPDKNGSTLKPLQALVGGNIETFDIAFGEEVSLYVNEEGLFTCPPNRAIFATEEMAKAGYLSQLDFATWEFPAILKLAIATLCSQYFPLLNNNCCNYSDCLHSLSLRFSIYHTFLIHSRYTHKYLL